MATHDMPKKNNYTHTHIYIYNTYLYKCYMLVSPVHLNLNISTLSLPTAIPLFIAWLPSCAFGAARQTRQRRGGGGGAGGLNG